MSKQKIRVPQEAHRNPGLTKRFGLPAITAIFARASRWGTRGIKVKNFSM
jgi:hypothetical protein